MRIHSVNCYAPESSGVRRGMRPSYTASTKSPIAACLYFTQSPVLSFTSCVGGGAAGTRSERRYDELQRVCTMPQPSAARFTTASARTAGEVRRAHCAGARHARSRRHLAEETAQPTRAHGAQNEASDCGPRQPRWALRRSPEGHHLARGGPWSQAALAASPSPRCFRRASIPASLHAERPCHT
eukprot:scaffold13449_cov28-Tisochrysis_lutea.AAC.5